MDEFDLDLIWLFVKIFLGIVLLVFLLAWIEYNSAAVSARIYNERNNTHYSASDFFWAEGTITNYTGNGRRNTVNVNIGDSNGTQKI